MEKHIEVQCQYCMKLFAKAMSQIKKTGGKNFCSRQCSAKRRLGIQNNPPKDRVCYLCSAVFRCSSAHRSRKYCQSCSVDKSHLLSIIPRARTIGGSKIRISINYKGLTIREAMAERYVEGKHRSHIYDFVRRFSRSWNRILLLSPCERCGYSKHVELCHIKSVSSYPIEATLGEVNHPTNLVVLCKNCHWEFDHNMVTIDDIRSGAPHPS